MKDQILQSLRELRAAAIQKGVEAAFFYHEEDSYLMRFANSAISLNTNEHLIRLEIIAFDGKRRASYEMITDLDKLEEMKAGLDTAVEMVRHAMPLTYQPTIPAYSETYEDERGYDEALGTISGEERLEYFNQASKGLETDQIRLSGIFSCGTNICAQTSTRSEYTQYFKTSDAQVNVVLSHSTLKWEVVAEQSAQSKSDLDPAALRRDLIFLLERYQREPARQIPVGEYDIVFGPAATADLVSIISWVGFNGGLMKRGFSFLNEDQVGKKVFSDSFTLTDDPTRLETFPYRRDWMGMARQPFPLFERGVFKGFVWSQDEADEFKQQPTGHTVDHYSLVMGGGEVEVSTLEELVKMRRERDILYIPFLHYMNIVNPSKGLVTASSRFGALLLKADGSVVVPFNVRVTQSLLDIFGDKVAWMSKAQTVYNTSMSYEARNPTALVLPVFMRVNGLEISHSNASY
ncbi:MAG TPA: metallopeptidase TldD-related protein [Levilinea sp.]|nr:metallopeptidase TldD-related protein [Levilinea sp.]